MNARTLLLDMKEDDQRCEDAFHSALPGAQLINWDNPDNRNADLSAVNYAVVWGPEPGLLAQCPELKVIFSVGAGVDHIMRDASVPDLPIVRFGRRKS